MGKFKTEWTSLGFVWGKNKTGQIQSCIQYIMYIEVSSISSKLVGNYVSIYTFISEEGY